jgi:hypothetical protein
MMEEKWKKTADCNLEWNGFSALSESEQYFLSEQKQQKSVLVLSQRISNL